MTLALTSISTSFAVVTVDGRCTVREGDNVKIDDAYQKLIVVPASRLVIYNHGQNRFGGVDWKEVMYPWIDELAECAADVKRASLFLQAKFDALVRTELVSMDIGTQAGFIVAGFGRSEKEPSAHEVLWRRVADGIRVENDATLPIGVRTSGDGEIHISKRKWNDISGKTVKEVREIHRSIMAEAIGAVDAKINSVGGHVHEVVITRFPCWSLPPRETERDASL